MKETEGYGGRDRCLSQIRVSEDEAWTQFGPATGPDWSKRCDICRESVSTSNRPGEVCVNCWKVEMWGCSPVLPEAMDDFALRDAAEALAMSAGCLVKVSKQPIPVVRSGIPREGYPDAQFVYLLMAYAGNIAERDAVRASLCEILGLDRGCAFQIPVRRGCWIYDDILGPWVGWYPEDKDMEKT